MKRIESLEENAVWSKEEHDCMMTIVMVSHPEARHISQMMLDTEEDSLHLNTR